MSGPAVSFILALAVSLASEKYAAEHVEGAGATTSATPDADTKTARSALGASFFHAVSRGGLACRTFSSPARPAPRPPGPRPRDENQEAMCPRRGQDVFPRLGAQPLGLDRPLGDAQGPMWSPRCSATGRRVHHQPSAQQFGGQTPPRPGRPQLDSRAPALSLRNRPGAGVPAALLLGLQQVAAHVTATTAPGPMRRHGPTGRGDGQAPSSMGCPSQSPGVSSPAPRWKPARRPGAAPGQDQWRARGAHGTTARDR
jgi:hypothetical protein